MYSARYSPLYPQKERQRACGAVALGRSPRPRLWTSAVFSILLLSIFYGVELTRNLKFTYFYATSSAFSHPSVVDDRPPAYTELRAWEMTLPQHNLDLPYPEGRTGRYVFFSNSLVNHVGWNNKLNDMLLNTWLAHESNRAYVFHDFIWAKSHYPWPTMKGDADPRTPLNALVSGPSAGGPWDRNDTAPRSVSEAWFDIVCPKHERRIINTRDVKPALQSADGKVIFETWRRLLDQAPERCIVVEAATAEEDPLPETFDIQFWSGERSVSLWDEFKISPVSRLLGTSRNVESAIDGNRQLFQAGSQGPSKDSFDNVLSIHVRRGDFKEACIEHAEQNSTFYNWNLLPFLPDKFSPPPAPPGIVLPEGRNTPENESIFLARCLPSAESITQKVRKARKEYLRVSTPDGYLGFSPGRPHNSSLDVVYIMSNDRTPWLDNLKETLKKDGWNRIVTSRDLELTPEQKAVGVAVDMDIGRRSAVFIGNGWSSFTSNVVHRRLVDEKQPISIRFW